MCVSHHRHKNEECFPSVAWENRQFMFCWKFLWFQEFVRQLRSANSWKAWSWFWWMKFHLKEISHRLIRIREITSRYNFIQISTSDEVLDCLYFIIFFFFTKSVRTPFPPHPSECGKGLARVIRDAPPPPHPANGTLFRLFPVKTSV